jgi:putative nucleotidyltransferase with HDIG domain
MPKYDDITRLVSIITALREPFDHHGQRVAPLAKSLAEAVGMNAGDVTLIGIGAELHDIGKLLVDAGLINAERKLLEHEKQEINKHAALGWAIVQQAGYDQIVLDVVRHHHERFDGTGYPDRLAGYSIPLSARVVAVCDCYEALTSDRPYREAFSHNFAMAMVQKEKRAVFDPELVDLFFAKVAK